MPASRRCHAPALSALPPHRVAGLQRTVRPGAPPPACQVADTISELKLGNGTSILIFANIASALPTRVGAALTQAADKDTSTLGV